MQMPCCGVMRRAIQCRINSVNVASSWLSCCQPANRAFPIFPHPIRQISITFILICSAAIQYSVPNPNQLQNSVCTRRNASVRVSHQRKGRTQAQACPATGAIISLEDDIGRSGAKTSWTKAGAACSHWPSKISTTSSICSVVAPPAPRSGRIIELNLTLIEGQPEVAKKRWSLIRITVFRAVQRNIIKQQVKYHFRRKTCESSCR